MSDLTIDPVTDQHNSVATTSFDIAVNNHRHRLELEYGGDKYENNGYSHEVRMPHGLPPRAYRWASRQVPELVGLAIFAVITFVGLFIDHYFVNGAADCAPGWGGLVLGLGLGFAASRGLEKFAGIKKHHATYWVE